MRCRASLVVDGTWWLAEVLDERGHAYADIEIPIEDRQRQRGIATACQALLDQRLRQRHEQ